MKKHFISICFLFIVLIPLSAKNYFVSTEGNDLNNGSLEAPFATVSKAQSMVQAGDTVFIRQGTYKIKEDQIMKHKGIWAYVFNMDKSGNANNRICYWGYKNERPVFDLSEVKPADKRIIGFFVSGSYLHFKNFEVVGTQVTIVGHTQSECIRNKGGNNNIYEHLAMHDGMAIGFYLINGSNNLILNCDAYNNFDYISDGGEGGNVDGFGGHSNTTECTGNVFRGCRAWYNSDDGYDLINARTSYTIENCWAFYNGYRPHSFISAGDGAGFKSGGYGMKPSVKAPPVAPRHIIRNCIAYYNKNQGFYANHHLSGNTWYNNTGYKNPSNFNMLNRIETREVADIDGYGHIIKNNLSYSPRNEGKHLINVNTGRCEISNNSFLPDIPMTDDNFISLDASQLTAPRKADGSLPDIDFMKPKKGSKLADKGAYATEE